MTTRMLILALVCAVSLFGQRRRFSWQDYCFNNPRSPVCSGNDYAVKHPKPGKNGTSPNVGASPLPPAPQNAPSVIRVGGVDWRFADPLADVVVGFRFSAISASPLGRSLIARLGASQGLTEAEMQKIFDEMTGADQVALSVRGNQVVAMITGRAVDPNRHVLYTDLKAVPVSGSTMLIGHTVAVDQAVQRMAANSSPEGLARLAAEWPANSEIRAAGAAGLVSPEAENAGAKRFSLTLSVEDRLTGDLALEFDEAPGAIVLAGATLEGKVARVRMTLETDEAHQKIGPFAGSPLGQRLAALVKAAQYLPARDTPVSKQAKPVIHGLPIH